MLLLYNVVPKQFITNELLDLVFKLINEKLPNETHYNIGQCSN